MSSLPGFVGQGWLQVGELALAFLLSASIGLERQMHGKSAGLRTQAIVGTSAALILLISKYGFMDVLSDHVVLDPSRVAAQVVSGIGFLGAGLILTRRGTVLGLTTAASVWETAAIGMAAGAGLWLLALLVTGLHFVIALGLGRVGHRIAVTREAQLHLEVRYEDGRGLLRQVLGAITTAGWSISRAVPHPSVSGTAALGLEVVGRSEISRLVALVADLDGVRDVRIVSDDDPD